MRKHTATRAVMFPPRKILVPMDLSDVSKAAWKEAKAFSKFFGARVRGLYVQEWVHTLFGGIENFQLTAEASRKAFEALRSSLPGADISAVQGSADEAILAFAERDDSDLIVMGSHGRTGFQRAVKGSVSEAIVRRSTLPVLVAHRFERKIRKVLAPVNFTPYAATGLLYAAEAAAALGARLEVLHVLDMPIYGRSGSLRSYNVRLKLLIGSIPESLSKACRPRASLAFGDPAEEIVRAAKDGVLVVLAAHRRGFLRETILGTTAERVLRYSAGLVLTVPSQAHVPAKEKSRGARPRATPTRRRRARPVRRASSYGRAAL